jgi:transposase
MVVMRARIILLAAEGLQNKVIAERLQMPAQIVSKRRKRFCVEGLAGLEERPRSGRPPRRKSEDQNEPLHQK